MNSIQLEAWELWGPACADNNLQVTQGNVQGTAAEPTRHDVLLQVLVDQPDVFVKAGTAFFPGSSLTGNGLLVSDGAEWRRQRRLSNPAFRKAAVDRWVVLLQWIVVAAILGTGGGRPMWAIPPQ